MKFYYVYALALNNNQFYIGYTANLKRRYNEHRYGKVHSTKNRRPFELVYFEAYPRKSDAERRENYLKSTKGKRVLKLQLKDFRSDRNI